MIDMVSLVRMICWHTAGFAILEWRGEILQVEVEEL